MFPERIENLHGARPQVLRPAVFACELFEGLDAQITDRGQARLCELLGGLRRGLGPPTVGPADRRQLHLNSPVANGTSVHAAQRSDFAIRAALCALLADQIANLIGDQHDFGLRQSESCGESIDVLLFDVHCRSQVAGGDLSILFAHQPLFGLSENATVPPSQPETF